MSGLVKLYALCRQYPVLQWPSMFNRHIHQCKSYNSVVQKYTNSSSRFSTKHSWEVDTNVTKDVILYSHNNEKFHRYLNLFALTQLGFWLYLAEFSMSTLRDVPVKKGESETSLPWYRSINLGENKYRRGITTMCVAVGELFCTDETESRLSNPILVQDC